MTRFLYVGAWLNENGQIEVHISEPTTDDYAASTDAALALIAADYADVHDLLDASGDVSEQIERMQDGAVNVARVKIIA